MKTIDKFHKLLHQKNLFIIQSTPCSKKPLEACIFIAMEETKHPCKSFTEAIDWLYERSLEESFI